MCLIHFDLQVPRGAFFRIDILYPSVRGIVVTDVDQVGHNFKATTKISTLKPYRPP